MRTCALDVESFKRSFDLASHGVIVSRRVGGSSLARWEEATFKTPLCDGAAGVLCKISYNATISYNWYRLLCLYHCGKQCDHVSSAFETFRVHMFATPTRKVQRESGARAIKLTARSVSVFQGNRDPPVTD